MTQDTSYSAFMRECSRHPLLTASDEIRLSRSIQKSIELLNRQSAGGVLTKSEQRLVHVGNRAKQRMVASNLRMVVKIAHSYSGRVRHLSLLDLVQEGSLGLMRAVELFDATRGYKFSTYAYWWIRQSVTRAITQLDSSIRAPLHIAEKFSQVRGAAERLTKELNRTPTRNELAASMDIKPAELELLMSRLATPCSLDASIVDDGSTLIDLIADPKSNADSDDLNADDYWRMYCAIGMLDPREQEIVMHRHHVQGHEQMTLTQIGAKIGVSRSRVSELEKRAVRKIRTYMVQMSPLADPRQLASVHTVSC